MNNATKHNSSYYNKTGQVRMKATVKRVGQPLLQWKSNSVTQPVCVY